MWRPQCGNWLLRTPNGGILAQNVRVAPMESVLASIISALVSGAVAKAADVGGKAIADAMMG